MAVRETENVHPNIIYELVSADSLKGTLQITYGRCNTSLLRVVSYPQKDIQG